MKLDQEQLNILAHVVEDPQGWADHAESTIGKEAVLKKVEKYRASYEAEKDGADYKTRAQKEADDKAARIVERQAAIQARKDKKLAEDSAFKSKVIEILQEENLI